MKHTANSEIEMDLLFAKRAAIDKPQETGQQ
jgi:hypothetical protein